MTLPRSSITARSLPLCKAHGVEPVVTLFAFTNHKWLIAKGGWEAESTVEYFKRYVSYVMEQLGSELHIVCTINEANMGLQLAAISKRFRLMAETGRQGCFANAQANLPRLTCRWA